MRLARMHQSGEQHDESQANGPRTTRRTQEKEKAPETCAVRGCSAEQPQDQAALNDGNLAYVAKAVAAVAAVAA
jgi:hypothetical protein